MSRPKNSDGIGGKGLTMNAKLYTYYTDFNRENALTFSYTISQVQEPGLVWSFKTNIDPDYFELNMSPRQVRNFLYKMEEIYRTRKVSA